MLKIYDRSKLCLIGPLIWIFCLTQCLLGMPQDMGLVNDELRSAWQNAGKRD